MFRWLANKLLQSDNFSNKEFDLHMEKLRAFALNMSSAMLIHRKSGVDSLPAFVSTSMVACQLLKYLVSRPVLACHNMFIKKTLLKLF